MPNIGFGGATSLSGTNTEKHAVDSCAEITALIQQHRNNNTPLQQLLTTESPNPLTLNLAEEAQTNILHAYAMLQKVDQHALKKLQAYESRIHALATIFFEALNRGRRIRLGGCGSAARAAMVAERLFREAFPLQASLVSTVSAGGDLVIVRAAEGFEDKPEYGHEQLLQSGWQTEDIYVGVSASGGAGYVSGQIETVLAHMTTTSPKPIFLVCNPFAECLQRFADDTKTIFHHSKKKQLASIEILDISVGEMGLSGSTRMQAATAQLIILGFALLQAGQRFTNTEPLCIQSLLTALQISMKKLPRPALTQLIQYEVDACRNAQQYMAYYADPQSALTVATDTTERSPTFNQPYFENDADNVPATALCRIIINGCSDQAQALQAMLGRELNPLDWVGRPGKQDEAKTTLHYLCSYDLTENIKAKRKRMSGRSDAVDIIIKVSHAAIQITFSGQQIMIPMKNNLPTVLIALYQQLILKMVLNIHSTLVAGKMGYYRGNLMLFVRASNEKLIDRAITLTEKMLLSNTQLQITRHEISEMLYRMMLVCRPGESIVLNTYNAILRAYLNQTLGSHTE